MPISYITSDINEIEFVGAISAYSYQKIVRDKRVGELRQAIKYGNAYLNKFMQYYKYGYVFDLADILNDNLAKEYYWSEIEKLLGNSTQEAQIIKDKYLARIDLANLATQIEADLTAFIA